MSQVDDSSDEVLAARAADGDEEAAARLFERHRTRMRRMVVLRLDARLKGRIDPSDVLQEAYLDFAGKVKERDANALPVHLWLRLIAGERLLQIHRRHIDVQGRAVGREVSLQPGTMPDVTSLSLAQNLLAGITSPSMKVAAIEARSRLEEAINAMDPIDREILVLRHFEEMSNQDTARLLGLKKSAASNRYVRALGRLKEILEDAGLV